MEKEAKIDSIYKLAKLKKRKNREIEEEIAAAIATLS